MLRAALEIVNVDMVLHYLKENTKNAVDFVEYLVPSLLKEIEKGIPDFEALKGSNCMACITAIEHCNPEKVKDLSKIAEEIASLSKADEQG